MPRSTYPPTPTAQPRGAAIGEAWELRLPLAVLEINDEILRSRSRSAAFRNFASGLRRLLDCPYVAIVSGDGGRWRTETFTHLETFDPQGDTALALERYCREHAAAPLTDAEPIRPLELASGDKFLPLVPASIAGPPRCCAFVALGERPIEVDRRSLQILSDHIGPALEATLKAQRRSRWESAAAAARAFVRKHRGKCQFAAVAAACLLLVPVTDRIRCAAELEPYVRRHVAAPFDGVLQECLVKPGDAVKAGQALARLDAKELRWELTAAAADRDRAAKSADVNAAAGKTAAAQIDRLESRRLAERVKLLENRLAKLVVAAPIDGFVLSGNLERVEGAPVKVGQSLFEIAPLDRMIVEVLVPETEIDDARPDARVKLSFASMPGESLSGTVRRIHPRAEIRDHKNVFVAEVQLDAPPEDLRPGMKGVARVETSRRPLVWILGRRLSEAFWRLIN